MKKVMKKVIAAMVSTAMLLPLASSTAVAAAPVTVIKASVPSKSVSLTLKYRLAFLASDRLVSVEACVTFQ